MEAEKLVQDKLDTAGALPLGDASSGEELLPQWTLLVHWQIIVELSARWESRGGSGVARRLARVRRRHRAGALQRVRDRRRDYAHGLHPVWLDTLAMTRAQMLVVARAVRARDELTQIFDAAPLPARNAAPGRIEAGIKQVLGHQERALLLLARRVDAAPDAVPSASRAIARVRPG